MKTLHNSATTEALFVPPRFSGANERNLGATGSYIQVVLQRLWSGSVTGGEAQVVLQGVFVGQQLLGSSSRVGQLASDRTEFL